MEYQLVLAPRGRWAAAVLSSAWGRLTPRERDEVSDILERWGEERPGLFADRALVVTRLTTDRGVVLQMLPYEIADPMVLQ